MRGRFILLICCLADIVAAAAPAPNATIVKFSALQPHDPNAAAGDASSGSGPLRLTYSDGTVVTIPAERGQFSDGNAVVPQTVFEQIALAPDRRTIGWLADYMMCAQSYPCPLELVIFHAGARTRKMAPKFGTIWGWMFIDGGAEVVVHSGFPHGDMTGEFTLYDVKTGTMMGSYAKTRDAPSWVAQYLAVQQN
jgi:hypothetical protein